MRYPLGIQDFRRLREDGYVYVDKTREVIGMLDAGAALFLSRPRRFGKSLTVSTLAELYSGTGRLFGGLWAEEHWDFARMERPVIWMRFNDIDASKGLEAALVRELRRIAGAAQVELPFLESPAELLRELIKALAAGHASGRCVVLVDEYDKPIVDYLRDLPRAEENRDTLKRFFGVLKGSGHLVEKVFLTGVGAFSKVSLFSDLNHVTNLTLHPAAQTVMGWTEAELDEYFAEDLAATGYAREEVRRWYNGYSWGGEARVYNPWSIINLMSTRVRDNYWSGTGSPTWLVEMLRDGRRYDLSDVVASAPQLLDFRLEDINPAAALFQTGYLTIWGEQHHPDELPAYALDYPNLEVKSSLFEDLLGAYAELPTGGAFSRMTRLRAAFRQNDLDQVFAILTSLYAEIPYDWWTRDDEAIFHAILFLTFNLVGVSVRAEVHTARDRCDALVETATHVYALEFKRDRPVAEALAQIADRGYLDGFRDSGKTSVAIGVRFDSEARNIGEWATAP